MNPIGLGNRKNRIHNWPHTLAASKLSDILRHSTSQPRQKVKSVTFGDATVFHHPIILGDSPAVSEGVPLTISWQAQHVSVVSIGKSSELFDKDHRPIEYLQISKGKRYLMAIRAGYSPWKIFWVTRQVDSERQKRAASTKLYFDQLREQQSIYRRPPKKSKKKRRNKKGDKSKNRRSKGASDQ